VGKWKGNEYQTFSIGIHFESSSFKLFQFFGMKVQMENLVQVKPSLYVWKILEMNISKVGSHCSFEDLKFTPKKKRSDMKLVV